ncbi:flagellar hook-basal body complex protein [Phaeovibrio sulfidiphilus]|uniref:Flagellar hook protein FlgE n=1 Tax=Phaeovibrio sulfidiphilus TaxID=1220600 RepID=A0A8J7CBF1_9PROT|nr:flagellar hook-basal body complex protein [Phaeovibrio sulfidiphilus]MBE1236078.1 flagellar hook-basal body complex protein [Phaeovibrio sulfidiphilus]
MASLYGALFSGVSGLQAQTVAMGAIADNVTNINTVGYKSTDTQFQTLVTQQISRFNYTAGGVQARPRMMIENQGMLQATTNLNDVGIAGSGFFVVSPGPNTGTFLYTRAGSFQTDQNGYFVNAAGYYLQGWPLMTWDGDPSRETIKIGDDVYMRAYPTEEGVIRPILSNDMSPENLRPLNVGVLGSSAEATRNIKLSINLQGDAKVGVARRVNVPMYDSLGIGHSLSYNWTKVGSQRWDSFIDPPRGAYSIQQKSQLGKVYESSGRLDFTEKPAAGSDLKVTLNGNQWTLKFIDSASGGTANPLNQSEGDDPSDAGAPNVISIDVSSQQTLPAMIDKVARALHLATCYEARTKYKDSAAEVLAQGNVDTAQQGVTSADKALAKAKTELVIAIAATAYDASYDLTLTPADSGYNAVKKAAGDARAAAIAANPAYVAGYDLTLTPTDAGYDQAKKTAGDNVMAAVAATSVYDANYDLTLAPGAPGYDAAKKAAGDAVQPFQAAVTTAQKDLATAKTTLADAKAKLDKVKVTGSVKTVTGGKTVPATWVEAKTADQAVIMRNAFGVDMVVDTANTRNTAGKSAVLQVNPLKDDGSDVAPWTILALDLRDATIDTTALKPQDWRGAWINRNDQGKIVATNENAADYPCALWFDGSGNVMKIFGTDKEGDTDPTTNIDIAWANGSAAQSINQWLGNYGAKDGMQQLDSAFVEHYKTQDGKKFGNFQEIEISPEGIVIAKFDNGVRLPIFQIPLATFMNGNGLAAVTGNTFIDTSQSGLPTLREANSGLAGKTNQGTLEASTADIGTEFTNMITTQRAYSAATKIITTSDDMLNELVNIKR